MHVLSRSKITFFVFIYLESPPSYYEVRINGSKLPPGQCIVILTLYHFLRENFEIF